MKRIFYTFAFSFLGLLVATIVHGVLELIVLDLIFDDPTNANSFWWREWGLIHAVGAAALWTGGAVIGLFVGIAWWSEYGNKPGAFGWGK